MTYIISIAAAGATGGSKRLIIDLILKARLSHLSKAFRSVQEIGGCHVSPRGLGRGDVMNPGQHNRHFEDIDEQ
jgi:hypothetical protein